MLKWVKSRVGPCALRRVLVSRSIAIGLEQRDGWDAIKLLASLEEGDLQDKEISKDLASQLLDQGAGSSSRSTCKSNVCQLMIFLGCAKKISVHGCESGNNGVI